MTLIVFPFVWFVAGPLFGMGVARLFGRLTWPRALIASAAGTVIVVGLALMATHGGIGLPRRIYYTNPAELRPTWHDYRWIAAPVALLGLASGAVLFALVRLVVRVSNRNAATKSPPA